jgi:putative membrane protein
LYCPTDECPISEKEQRVIVRDRPAFWELAIVWRLSILPRIAPQLASVFLWSCIVVWLGGRYAVALHTWTVAPFTLLGVALSIFLGFRNSACYDRWWEARRQLGSLVAETRSFARICVSIPAIDSVSRECLLRDTILFCNELMRSLKREAPSLLQSAEPSLPRNTPDLLLRRIGRGVAEVMAHGNIGETLYKLLEERLIAFAAIQAACERIQSTPTPFTYTLLVDRTTYAYCLLLPLGLTSTMGWMAPIFATLVAYAFFGLDALGDELERPFGDHVNALPLSALSRTIEISILEALEAETIPEMLRPVASVLT